jgi:hypothetical protein
MAQNQEATERLDPLPGWEFGQALRDAGIIGNDVARVVIDVPCDNLVKLYVERAGSRKLLRVISTLQGVRIETVDAEEVVPDGPDLSQVSV